jgi:hypothetical protein
MRVHQEGQVDGRQLLDRWVERGLIRREQADHIRVEEGWEPAQPTSVAVAAAGPHGSLIVEALVYLGGVPIVVAASLIANWYWAPHPNLGPPRSLFPPQRFLLPQDGWHSATLQNAPGGRYRLLQAQTSGFGGCQYRRRQDVRGVLLG